LVVTVLSEGVAMIVALVVLFAIRPDWPGTDFLALAAFGGVIEAIAAVAIYRALSFGAMGVVSPIAACSAIVPVAFGIAMGEALATMAAIGIPIALIGVIAVAWTPGGVGEAEGRLATGVGLALIAALGFGGFVVVLDEAVARAGVVWAVVVARFTLVAAAGLVALVVRSSLSRASGHALPLIAVGFFDLSAVFLIAAATAEGLLAVVGVLAALYPIVTLLLARFVLGERLRASQRIGTAIAFVGVAMIAATA
jgi:drug/metabolite transporter (DMT)-like permease